MLAKPKLPSWYPEFCWGVSVLGWIPMVVTPPLIHGGTVATEAASWGGIVLGGYCSLELVRSGDRPWFKAPATAGVALYGLMVAVRFYFALPHVV